MSHKYHCQDNYDYKSVRASAVVDVDDDVDADNKLRMVTAHPPTNPPVTLVMRLFPHGESQPRYIACPVN